MFLALLVALLAAPQPAGFFFPPEELQRVLPRDAVTRVGLMADLADFDTAVAAAAFTAAAREAGLEVVPLLMRREAPERVAPLLAEGYQLDALAALQAGQLAGERAAVVQLWSKTGARLGTLTSRPPPTPEERARAGADAEYARRHLTVDGAQQYQGDDKRPLSRDEFYALVGRDDLAHKEQGISLARGVLVGGGVTVGGVGLALELLQILFGAVVGPVDIAACEVDRGVNRNPYGPPDTRSCSGPQQSPIPLLMVFGGGIVAITGAAISNDAASPEERETLARDYNLRLRETSGQARLAPTPAVTVGLSAAAVPQGGLLVLRGRF